MRPAFSQTEKGNFLVGGSLSFTNSKNGDLTFNSLSLNPTISYFFIENLAVGVITPYTYSNNSFGGITTNSNSYSIGPTVRYYFPLNEHWAIFPEVDYSAGWQKSHDNTASTSSTNIHLFRGGAGATYFINKNVGIEGFLYYQDSRTDYTYYNSAMPSNNFTSTKVTSINFRIGLQIYLARHKV